MIRWWLAAAGLVIGAGAALAIGQSQGVVSPAELAKAIDTLGSFDYATRTASAKTVRRAPLDVGRCGVLPG